MINIQLLILLSTCCLTVQSCKANSKCTWTVCRTSYNNFVPQPSPGSCVTQSSAATHTFTTHTRSSGCPGNKGCSGVTKYRDWCSCKELNHCWWASWGSWTNEIHQETCGTQRRYRKGEKSFIYIEKEDCHNSKTECPREYDVESRTWCNCKKTAVCSPGPWTSFEPQPLPEQCTEQKRHRDMIATYTHIGQRDNCAGISPKCPYQRIFDKRTLCNCPYKECIEGPWTSWERNIWNGNCPSQRRFKRYRAVTKYRLSYVNCIGIGPRTCPDPIGDIRELEVTCPRLPVPFNGYHMDKACEGASTKCNAICRMSCNKGFLLIGSRYVSCRGDGKWSGTLGTCKDIEPPVINCPHISTHFDNEPNKNYAIVDLPTVTATDNTGTHPTLTSDHSSPLKVFIGSPVKVLYTAIDDAGNKRSCRLEIIVKDSEPPKVMSCPKDKVFQTEQVPKQVFWSEPKFHDNVDGENVNVPPPSRGNGDYFAQGKHTIVYLARDQALNTVKCMFSVQIDLMQCPLYGPPENGAASCNIRKNGVIETHICTVSCKPGHWFAQGENIQTLYAFYVCGENGQWRGQNTFDPTKNEFFVPIPKESSPWPECTAGHVTDGIKREFQMFAGKCGDAKEQQKLKEEFVAAMKNDIIINNLFCVSSSKHCTVENLVVHCGNGAYSSNNGMMVEFTLYVQDKSQSSDKIIAIKDELSKLSFSFQDRVNKGTFSVKSINQVKSTATKMSCEPGYEHRMLTSNLQDWSDSNNKCVKCSRGTFYDFKISRCKVCLTGYYQPKEAQTSCLKCPAGTSTTGVLSQTHQQCKEICMPGTYSFNGLASCLACPISTYQPMNNGTFCLACPSGKVTSDVGATSLEDCSLPGVEVNVTSMACGDVGVPVDTCGLSSIYVNNQQRSPMKRGMNFAAVDAYTGNFIEAVAFDWHDDWGACDKTYTWITKLRQEVIIIAVIQDEATTCANRRCSEALVLIGGKRPFQSEYRSSFAMIGYKGAHVVTWIQQKKSHYGRGPTVIKESIKLLSN